MSFSFDEVAGYYARRIAYLPKFFEVASEHLALNADSRLLDIACGTGELSAGFSKFCGEITAIDQSAKMLELARSNLPPKVSLVQCDINRPSNLDIGQFDAVVIGRALRYLDRDPLCKVLDQVLMDAGSILVCGAGLHESTPWVEKYVGICGQFRDKSVVLDPSWRKFFKGSQFEQLHTLVITGEAQFSIDDLINNLLSYGAVSTRIKANVDGFRTQLTNALRPYFTEKNMLPGTVVSHGGQYRRPMAG